MPKKGERSSQVNLAFPHFSLYAEFLLQHHYDALVRDMVRRAREGALPLFLKLREKFSEEEIVQMSEKSLAEDILVPVSQDKPFEKINEKIRAWKADVLIVPKDQLNTTDVTSVHSVRKHALLEFLAYYDCPKEELVALFGEIDTFFDICIDLGLKAYEEIQKEELKNKTEMLSGIMSNIPVIVTRLDKEGRILFSAGAGLASLGLKDNDLVGKNVFDIYPDADNTRKALTGQAISFMNSAKSASGEIKEFHTFYMPEKDGVLGFSIDITRQHEAETQFVNLVEGVRDYAIFMLKPDGTIASWNEGARRLKGYSKEEIIGKHFSIFYPKEKQEEGFPEYELQEASKIGRFEDEGIRLRKDGTSFYANVVITALFDEKKKLLGFTKITRDLTERKAHEDALRKMNAELEEKVKERTEELVKTIRDLKKINNDLDNFIYTASHDLKAPISNIEGLIQGLYEELGSQPESNPNLKTFQELINASIKRFQATIHDLTEVAKIQKEVFNAEEVDLSDLLEDIKMNIIDLVLKNEAEISLNFQQCGKIKFVRKNLQSILYNLVSNGIKYRSPDRKPVVKLTCSFEKGYYVITCEDNGLGIRPEDLDKMFTMFKRFHNHVEGSGIGLYIVKKIIENAGGKIEVQSREGEGTVFKVYLPKDDFADTGRSS